MRAAIVIGLLLVTWSSAQAYKPDEVLDDPVLESRARTISAELRCLVCQNQSIDDSDAPLARDLRLLIRERLKAGDSNDQAIDFIVQRYGEFVLLRPVFAPHTWALWLGPPLLLLLAVIGIAVASRRRRASAASEVPPAPLSEEETQRLEALLKE